MPKLNKKTAKAVKDAESGGFGPLEPGIYTGQLSSVTPKESSNGNDMWVWEFDELQDLDGEAVPGRQWLNTVLPTDEIDSAWVFKQAFEAFGYEADSDTDEMIGERCQLIISQRVIEKGNRKGQMGNNIDRLMPLNGELAEAGAGSGKGGKDVF